jgi:DmsE family decaheme c-type cytochrome
MRKIFIPVLAFVFLMMVSLLCFSKEPAKEEDQTAEKGKEGYAGVEICQTCHAKVYDRLAQTAMGTLFLKHPQTAEEKLGCETCHGPASEHVASGGKSFAGMVRFTKCAQNTPHERSEVCLKCHQKRARLFWSGSIHEEKGLACTTCHVVHTAPGMKSRYQLANLTVEDTCKTCHKEQVAAEWKFSHHPLREGKMNCASCHNPHGTASPRLINAINIRELCFNCHAQYRGPFLFQHPPVLEDCFNCHQPHGSAYPALLKQPVIRLCRECHISFHNISFQAKSGPTSPLPGRIRTSIMMGSACIDCHRNIHGSNSFNGNLFFR